MNEQKEPTPEELAEKAAEENRQFLARCAEERRAIKERIFAGSAAQRKEAGLE